MRTVLAAAAAGALVLGSAGGAIAGPGKAKGPKDPKPGYVKVTKVDIHKHKKINLDDPYGDLKLRVKVRDTTGSEGGPHVTGVTLGLFESKRSLTPIADVPPVAVTEGSMKSHGKKKKKWITYRFTVAKDLLAPVESAIDAGTDGFKGYLCISEIETDATKQNKQTMRRLNMDPDKKTLRECVKVYDMTDKLETAPVTP